MIKKSEDGYLVSNIKHKIDHEINKVDIREKLKLNKNSPTQQRKKNVEAKTKWKEEGRENK